MSRAFGAKTSASRKAVARTEQLRMGCCVNTQLSCNSPASPPHLHCISTAPPLHRARSHRHNISRLILLPLLHVRGSFDTSTLAILSSARSKRSISRNHSRHITEPLKLFEQRISVLKRSSRATASQRVSLSHSYHAHTVEQCSIVML